ncbi:MAG: HYR domain-containing protein, partial [Bacteroidetes bacterium]|nr:HYR domain-containing protein [Bacteroidota bacterium]
SVGPDVRFNANSAGWNLIGIAGPTSGWTPTDLVGTASDPMNAALDELRLNGGVTKSHALLVCSRAIDAADPTGTAAMTDQRGVGRNINGNNDNVALPDIGAYERTTSLDNTPPTINPHPALRVFLDATGNATIAKDDVLLSAFDNCDILNTTVSKTSFSCADVGTVTLTLTATDRSFNVRTVNVDVEVIDDTPPALTPPANLAVDASSVNCGITLTSAQLGSPTTSDACGSVTVTNNAPGSLFFPVGQTLLTWFATDVNGNISTAMQTVTVNDNSNPVVIAPADITINTGADQCAVPLTDVSLGSPTVTDNCTTTIDHDAPASFPIGTTTVTWTATDASGNSGSASQSVTVIDATPPVLFAPQDLVLAAEINSCSRDGATIDLGTPTFSDNCTGVTVSNDKPANFPIGETIVTWTALDNVGNSTTVQQKVTVFDSNPPSVVAPPNIEVEVDQGTCAWTVDPNVLGTATSNDNCSVPSVANSAGTSLSAGTHRVIWTAIDANGNRATDVQIVTVVGEPPTIECPTPLPQYSTDAGRAGAVVTYGLPTVSSGCSDVEIIRTGGLGSGDFFPVGTTTVTYMAIDASNQIDICEFDVIVVDNEPPQISVHIAPVYLWPANNQMEEVKVTVDLWDNVPGTTAKLTKIESNQNINGDVLDASIGDFDLFFNLRAKNVQGPRTYTITYEATDAAGNKTSASADVTVPTQKPKDFESEDLPVPASVTLAQNYPNPFNPSTLISFGTPEEQHLELRVYNAMGMPVRTLVNTVLDAGQYTVEWDGRDDNGQPLSSGVYLYMLRSGSAHVERKMILAR